MCTGGPFKANQCSNDQNPVRIAYKRWLDAVGPSCRSSWDPLTVYAAIVGTDAAKMWEESGTDEIDVWGNENWDKSWTTNNEVSLWFQNNNDKGPVA